MTQSSSRLVVHIRSVDIRWSDIHSDLFQVSNQADCIKIACDFISPESVPTCKRLAEEFREQRLACGWPEDVIPFQSLLYYTWMSVDLTCRTMRAQRPPRYV